MLREGLTAQIRALGGEVVPLAHADHDFFHIDAVLIDAGIGGEPDVPAEPEPDLRSIVLIAPEARGRLPELRAMGFTDYLVKPTRQSSLAERLRIAAIADGQADEAEDALPLPVVAELTPKPLAQHAGNGRRILLVEDNPINAMLTRELLVRRGYAVNHVLSGESALEIAARERFDVVLTDIHMPGMDGVETAQHFREREDRLGRPRTPIVALTADAVETGKHACQDAGMDGFLTKPVDPAELDTMLETLFADARPRDAA